jgi:hypothetical protein
MQSRCIFLGCELLTCLFELHLTSCLQLPDTFKDFAAPNVGKKAPSKAFMTHCRREVMHAQWEILLDDEFMEAYKHGIVVECCDGITRRFYPRFFIYSADYPEKYVIQLIIFMVLEEHILTKYRILLSGIRDKGHCACPRCLIPLERVRNLGMALDMKQRKTLARVDDEARRRKIDIAREIIYQKNYAVNSKAVETILKEQSLAPASVSRAIDFLVSQLLISGHRMRSQSDLHR